MKRIILAFVASLCVPVIHASTIDLGVLLPVHTYAVSEDDLIGKFSDIIQFSTAPGVGSVFIKWYEANNSDFRIFGGYDLNFSGSMSFNASPGGMDSFLLSGIAGATVLHNGSTSFVPGSYFFEVTATPEASTWLMLAAGLGFMAWRLRRTSLMQ